MKRTMFWLGFISLGWLLAGCGDGGSGANDDAGSETESVETESESTEMSSTDSESDTAPGGTDSALDDTGSASEDTASDHPDTGDTASGDDDSETTDALCAAVDCGDHGSCEVDSGAPVCICDEGYTASGLSCVSTPEEITVSGMNVDNATAVSASEDFVQEALSAIVSAAGASMTDAAIDGGLSGAAVIYNACPMIYTDGIQIRKMFADFNVCACRDKGMRGVVYVEKETGGLRMTFLEDSTDTGYGFPDDVLNQWSGECDAGGDPLGEAPSDNDAAARFQVGDYYLGGQIELSRTTDLQDMVGGTIGYGFSTADGLPLTFTQAVMPNTETVANDELVYYIAEPVTFSVPASFNSSLTVVGLDRGDLVIPDFYVYFKGQLETAGRLAIVSGGPNEIPPVDWDSVSLEDPTLDLLCDAPIRTAPSCDAKLTSGKMAFEVSLAGVTIQVPASGEGRMESLGHHVGGDEDACYKEAGEENTCVCPTEGMSFEMSMPKATIVIINPVLDLTVDEGSAEPPETDTETDTEADGGVSDMQVFGRFEISVNFGFGFEIDDRACRTPDSIEMFYLGQDVINTAISYTDLYCAFNQTLYTFCASETPEAWAEEIYLTWGARGYYLGEWADDEEGSLEMGVNGEKLVEMLNNQAICGNLCQVPQCTLDEEEWVYPAFCDYSYMLPFGTCEGVVCDDGEICNPVTNRCVGCISDSDCEEADAPYCNTMGACVACRSDEHCPENTRCTIFGECSEGDCGPCEFKCREETICPECAVNEDCPAETPKCCGQTCDGAFKYTCVACFNNTHCQSGTCDMNTYTCTEGGCQTDDDCGGITPACDTESGDCVACTASNDTQCAAMDMVCETGSHQCVACVTGDDCPANAPVCKSADEIRPFTCVQCTADEHCDVACSTTVNRCTCDTVADCPDEVNQRCQGGICRD